MAGLAGTGQSRRGGDGGARVVGVGKSDLQSQTAPFVGYFFNSFSVARDGDSSHSHWVKGRVAGNSWGQ